MRRITLLAIILVCSFLSPACVQNPDKEEARESAANTNQQPSDRSGGGQPADNPTATTSTEGSESQTGQMPQIIKAASEGDAILVTTLIDTGSDVNTRNEFGVTPLMAASANGHLETINVLLAQGADVKAKDNKGLTARDYAANNSKFVVVELLNAHGGNK